MAGRWQVAGHIGDEYARMSGTSMATPHVTGAAALLAQQHADWTGAQLKATLMATATELSGVDIAAQGAGRVNLGTAIAAPVVPDWRDLADRAGQRWREKLDRVGDASGW